MNPEPRPFAATRTPATALTVAVPDFALGAACLVTWIAPRSVHPGLTRYLLLAVLLEFIIIHSSAFMGSMIVSAGDKQKKLVALLGLGAFYTLFVGAFSLAFRALWPLVSFWGMTANRMMGVMFGPPGDDERSYVQRSWAAGVVLYLGATMLSILLPVPRLGLGPGEVARLDLPGSGLWVDQPWRLCAFGFLYFTGTGWSELAGHRWLAGVASRPASARDRKAA